MSIEMDKKTFDSLTMEAVGHACFEPLIPIYQEAMRIRGSQTVQDVRAAFYKSLSQGQRALFMFFSYYDHAMQSEDELQRISRYYLSTQIFSAVKKGAEYFRDDDMARLLSLIEQAVSKNEESKTPELYHRLLEITPHTLVLIGTFIKENPADFIRFE